MAGTGRLLGKAALRPWRSVSLEGGILGKSCFSDKPCGGDLPQGGTFGSCGVMVAPGRIRFQGMGGEGSRGRDGPVSSAGKACIIKLLDSLTEGEAWVLWSARSFRKRANHHRPGLVKSSYVGQAGCKLPTGAGEAFASAVPSRAAARLVSGSIHPERLLARLRFLLPA